tara:strand:+ start:992 stop:1327 length:336 start_codon:yes stop_codon:yes gene_type:complete
MAQDFERTITKDIDASLADIRATSNSDDAIVGIRLANTTTSQIEVDVAVTDNSNNVVGYVIKNAPIPAGSSLELIDGGSKIVLQSGDKLRAKSNATDSLDVVVSAVDAIST